MQLVPSDGEALTECPKGGLAIPGSPKRPGVRFSLVIPTYNESRNLPTLIESLDGLLRPRLGSAFEIIVVDDDSPDHTWEVALDLRRRFDSVRIIRRQGERGLSTAVIRGWQAANGEILGVMDADLQHPPEVNLALLDEIDQGAELAAASRNIVGGGVSDWSAARRVLSRGAQLLGLLVLPSVLGRLSDPMSGYFMVRRSALAAVELDPLGYKILIEVVARGRVRWIGEVPYVFSERADGESKVTWRLYLEYLHHLIKLRRATLSSAKFFAYGLVALSGAVIELGLFYELSDPSNLGWGVLQGKLLAAQPALLWNFALNEVFTFREIGRAQPVRSWSGRLQRLLAFYAISLVTLVVSTLLLFAFHGLAGMNVYVANAVAIGSVTGIGYWLHRHLTWAPLVLRSAWAARREKSPNSRPGPRSVRTPDNAEQLKK